MSNNFILATGNAHKAEEFAKLFDEKLIQISSAKEKVNVVEDGQSFLENALKKAQGYFEKYGEPVVADDSGLCVKALPDDLGIHSARFGGEGLSDRQRAELLLEKMKGETKRDAYFVCVLCFYYSQKEYYFFEGRVEGQISDIYAGEHGFGYDPVFNPLGDHNGKSIAQLPEWKMENSHRAKACKEASRFFKQRLST